MIALLNAVHSRCVTCGDRMPRRARGRARLFCDGCRAQRHAEAQQAYEARKRVAA